MHSSTFSVAGPLLITPTKIADERGFFSETYNYRTLRSIIGDIQFVQDNHSLSVKEGTIRGLHFQIAPMAQGKLIRASRGAIFDVAVDVRRSSPTYGQHVCAILSTQNWQQLWIPAGFAHGFCTLEPNTEVIYKVTEFYSPADERGILWNDPALGIQWPDVALNSIVIEKDKHYQTLEDSPIYFETCE